MRISACKLDLIRDLVKSSSRTDKAERKKASDVIDAISDDILREVAKNWVLFALRENRLHEYWEKRAIAAERRMESPISRYPWKKEGADRWTAACDNTWLLVTWARGNGVWTWEVWNTEECPDTPMKSGDLRSCPGSKVKAAQAYERLKSA